MSCLPTLNVPRVFLDTADARSSPSDMRGPLLFYGRASPLWHSTISPTSTARRKSVSSAFHQIACKNNAFPRAKLARHLWYAALGLSVPALPTKKEAPDAVRITRLSHCAWQVAGHQ